MAESNNKKAKAARGDSDRKVYTLRIQGLSFEEIARVVKDPAGNPLYSTRGAAYKAYQREAARNIKETQDYRELNIRRIERLISDLWSKREDPRVASVIDKLIRTQSVLTGAARGMVSGDGVTAPGVGGGTRALPQNTYANWANDTDIIDVVEIYDAELIEDDELDDT